MARLNGGIFSRPSGKTGGIVFGAARTRQGKVVTSRLLVTPSNPNTAGQQSQRNQFKSAMAIVRALGSVVYQKDFNRSVSQLPGFQSLMSTFILNLNGALLLSKPNTLNLGGLYYPLTSGLTITHVANAATFTWSDENGDNGGATDLTGMFVIPAAEADRVPGNIAAQDVGGSTRSDGSDDLTLTSVIAGHTYIGCLWFEGKSDTNKGMVSPAKFFSAIAA